MARPFWIGDHKRVAAAAALLLLMGTRPVSAQAGTTATAVLGQADFTHVGTNNISAVGIDTSDLEFVDEAPNIAIDKTTTPNGLYVVDPANNRVLGYSSASMPTNGQAADVVIGQTDFVSASETVLSEPRGAAVDSSGNLYVADFEDNRVLIFHSPLAAKAATGQTAGFKPFMVLGQGGSFTSVECNVGGTAPAAETLCGPVGVAIDSSNHVYVSDSVNERVLEYNDPVSSGNLAANLVFGQGGSFTSISSPQPPTATSLFRPFGLALDNNSNLYIADFSNARVLEFNDPPSSSNPSNPANLVLGQSSFTTNSSNLTVNGLDSPVGVAVDASGDVYVADEIFNRVLEYSAPLTSGENATFVFGQPDFSSDGCDAGGVSATTLCEPQGVGVDSAGHLFLGDGGNDRTLFYTNPLGGTPPIPPAPNSVLGQPDFVHSAPNTVTGQSINRPNAVAIDASSSPTHLYVTDGSNNRILGWNNAASFSNGASADLVIGQPDFSTSSVGTSAKTFDDPEGLAVDSNGNLYVADTSNNRVLEFNAPFAACPSLPCVGGNASTVFGQGGSFTAGGCNMLSSPTDGSLCGPEAVALDSTNNLYVADFLNNRVLEYNSPLLANSEPGSGDMIADLVFGQGGSFTTSNCNGPSNAISATTLCNPSSVAIAPTSGTVFVMDNTNSRMLGYSETAQPPSNVTANLVFGQSGSFTSGGFTCALGGANDPSDVCDTSALATDAMGDLYIAEPDFNRMVEFPAPIASMERPVVVWGQGGDFFSIFCNLDGTLPDAQTLCGPLGVAVSPTKDVFIADATNNRVLQYLPPFPPPGIQDQKPPPAPNGVLALSRSRLDFGPIRVGRMSKTAHVTIVNKGTSPITISRIVSSPDFLETNSCDHALPAKGKCEVTLAFRPLSVDRRGGHLVVFDNAKGGPHAVALRGFGVPQAPQRVHP